MTQCRQCGDLIEFDKKYRTSLGKYIPVDYHTGMPHRCQNYEIPCLTCGEPVTFNSDFTSDSGKMIPLEPENGDYHRCLQND